MILLSEDLKNARQLVINLILAHCQNNLDQCDKVTSAHYIDKSYASKSPRSFSCKKGLIWIAEIIPNFTHCWFISSTNPAYPIHLQTSLWTSPHELTVILSSLFNFLPQNILSLDRTTKKYMIQTFWHQYAPYQSK